LQLQEAQAELILKERLAVLGHFAGGVAHEIRNPLAAIDSSIYFLQMKLGDGDEKVMRHFERIRSNIGKSTAIIQSLLNLSRMEKPRTENLDIAELISDAVSTAQIPDAVGTRLDLPGTPLFADVDAEQIRMALKNILQNAVQAMDGSGALSIVAAPAASGVVEISITDTGPGIPAGHLEKVFEPLFSTKTHGIGFGLSITKMIIENHGGTVHAESPLDGGARFVLTLPASGKGETSNASAV
jgi:two-component system sensor kinase FixL